MPTFIGARLPATREQEPRDRTCEQKLRLDRYADTVAAAAPMEDLFSAYSEPRHEVLEVGYRRRGGAEHGRIKKASPNGEKREGSKSAADLEAPVGNVLVRHAIAGDVQRRAEEQRERTRADNGSHRSACSHVHRDDHPPIIAYAGPR